MTHPLVRRLALSAAVVVVLGFATSAGATAYFEIDSCDSPLVLGKAKWMRDLDCSGTFVPNIVIDRGTLDLNGHTLVTGYRSGVLCIGKCKVIGPGTITGNGSGVDGSESLKMKNPHTLGRRHRRRGGHRLPPVAGRDHQRGRRGCDRHH